MCGIRLHPSGSNVELCAQVDCAIWFRLCGSEDKRVNNHKGYG